jgi:Major Facilitator Superfamily
MLGIYRGQIVLNASWYRIISLAALQGAITLSWLIYNIYLPKLLIGYGFSPSLAVTLLIVENAIAVILEPLFGSLSDRAYQWIATKFGFVSLGVILTATLTILIPAVFVFRDLFSAISWILPGVLVAWAIAMTVFRTPAISLIGRYAFASELPIAMSFLTLVGGFVGAIRPLSQDFILSLGAPAAFTIASIVLLAATALLRYFDPPVNNNLNVAERQPIVWTHVGLLIIMGWGMAWGVRCVFETLPKVLKLNIPQFDPAILMVAISLAIAVSALPAGLFANKYGNRRAMLIGAIVTSIALLMMVFVPTSATVAIAVLLIIFCFSWITNGAVPLAINVFPPHRSGLAAGLYFSGFTGGISSFSSLFNPISNLTPLLGAICGAIGFIVAGGCVLNLSDRAGVDKDI